MPTVLRWIGIEKEDEHGRSLYTMTLRYPPEMVEKSFTLDELRVSDLWRPFLFCGAI